MLLQRSFDDLGTPLAEVTFCVLDLETTGGSHVDSSITEVGAVKVRLGEVTGTFQTLVDPGRPVPAFIRLLTGITDESLRGAPPIEEVLPSLLEFVRGTVLVAHNARFDVGFLDTALKRSGYGPLPNKVIDTATLARKILAGEVPNNKLATLARYLRCAHQPCHRAYADVLATSDVLHHLIERVAGFGVTTLEDLMAMSRTRMDGTFNKISMCEGLPHAPGVYRFLGAKGNTLYIGKASDLKSRVRQYFYGDPRRKMRDLLREAQSVGFEVHGSMLEAEVAEARAISREQPPYNRAGKRSGTWYAKLSVRAKTPKIAPARVPKVDGSLYLGPLPSAKAARLLIDTLRDSARIHRCTEPARCNGCAFSELGSCAGTSPEAHRQELLIAARAACGEHAPLLEGLARRMGMLSAQERFEEAAELRERAASLERHLIRASEVRALIDAGEIVLSSEGRTLVVRGGRLAGAADAGGLWEPGLVSGTAAERAPFVTAETEREARVILRWLRRGDARIVSVEKPWVSPTGARPTGRFEIKKEKA